MSATRPAQAPVQGDGDQAARARARHGRPRERSIAEWVTFGIATSILMTIVGLVIYDWVTAPSLPPTISIKRAGDIRRSNGQYYVPFIVENVGGDTAEAVQALAELAVDGEVVEEGEQQIDFLSGGEQHHGAFVFTRDPAQGELTLRIGSYKMP